MPKLFLIKKVNISSMKSLSSHFLKKDCLEKKLEGTSEGTPFFYKKAIYKESIKRKLIGILKFTRFLRNYDDNWFITKKV